MIFLYQNLFKFNILMLAVAISQLIDISNKNYGLVVYMFICVFIFFEKIIFETGGFSIFKFLGVGLLLTLATNYQVDRIESYVYSLLFIGFFLATMFFLKRSQIRDSDYLAFLRFVIYIFFVVLVIQQLQSYIGVTPYFNEISTKDNAFNVLSTEPSYAATVVVIVFLSYLQIKKTKKDILKNVTFNNDTLLWFLTVYQIIFIGSAYGVILLTLGVAIIFGTKNRFFALLFLLVPALAILKFVNYEPFMRIVDVMSVLQRGDFESEIINSDHSAAVRILPLFYFVSNLDNFSWFGLGVDYSNGINKMLIPGIEPDANAFWFIPSFVIDYGFINLVIFCCAVLLKILPRVFCWESVVFVLVLLNCNINTQLFWFVIVIFATNKHLTNFKCESVAQSYAKQT